MTGLADAVSLIGPGLSAKRLQTLQYLISALQKLAATRDCAIIVLSQCATKLQSDSGATLVPSINASVWEQGISTRLVLFRDWAWKDGEPSSICFAGIQKLEGRTGPEAIQSVAAFRIESVGNPPHAFLLRYVGETEMRLCKGPCADSHPGGPE